MKWLSNLVAGAAFALVLSCGILQPRPDPTRLFVLATLAELDPARPPAARAERSLGLGPLTFPEYVLGRELVSRRAITGLESSRYERWAEPLDLAVARVLASDLSFLTGARVVSHPWFGTDAPDASVRIRFERLELEERAQAVLSATWSLEDASGAILHEQQSLLLRALDDRSGATAARELSRALAELSAEIAAAWARTGA